MICSFRRCDTPCWWDARGARILSARLAERLEKRMRKGGLSITLTYDRSEWESAAELYHAQREQRHVRRFMHRLSRYLGASLNGLWMRKMEFHKGPEGWIHWHILLDWRSRIPVSVVRDLWGYGHVFIQKATRGRVRYLAKYVAKDMGNLPGYILGEPARSVRVVAVSPGFWRDESESDGDEEREIDGAAILDELAERPEGGARVLRWPCYRTVAHVIAARREAEETEVEVSQWWMDKWHTRWHRFRLSMSEVASVLASRGHELFRDGGTWRALTGDGTSDLLRELGRKEAWMNARAASGRQPAAAATLPLSTETEAPREGDLPEWMVWSLERMGCLTWRVAA